MKISAKNTEVMLYVSLQTQRSVCGNTLQEVEMFKYLGVVFTCDGVSTVDGRRSPRRLMHGLVKLTQFCVSFIALCSQNGSFQTPQSCQFSNRSLFRSSPMVTNLGK